MEIVTGVNMLLWMDLREAEESFRSFDYKEAYEQAAAIIEKVEPGVLKK